MYLSAMYSPLCVKVASQWVILKQLTLCGSQVRVPENDLAHDLNRRSRSVVLCCIISDEIMCDLDYFDKL